MGNPHLVFSIFFVFLFNESLQIVAFGEIQSLRLGSSVPEKDIMTIERVNHLTNKTIKILTGQSRPGPPPTPIPIRNQYNPNYPQNNYPQSPDNLGQGSGTNPNYQQQPPNSGQMQKQDSPAGIPEVYLQIIGAIEKLVGRMDKLDARLATVENIVYHLTTNKKEPEQGNCPENFIKMDGLRGKCFHISTLTKSRGLFDWQSAHAECRKLGGRLAEMIIYDDFLRISQFLIKYANAKNSATGSSSDFWIGGINPGLIWIWSESGQKVGMDGRFWNENDNSSNAPGCLKLSYSHRLDAFFFKGAPCSHSQNILCEVMDNTVARALASFEQELIAEEVSNNN